MPPKNPPRPNRTGGLRAWAGSGSAADTESEVTGAPFLAAAFGFGPASAADGFRPADAPAGFWPTAPCCGRDGAVMEGALAGGRARAASSIQPLALLLKSLI